MLIANSLLIKVFYLGGFTPLKLINLPVFTPLAGMEIISIKLLKADNLNCTYKNQFPH